MVNESLEPVCFVDFVAEWFARCEMPEVFYDDFVASFEQVCSSDRSGVRSENRVWGVP